MSQWTMVLDESIRGRVMTLAGLMLPVDRIEPAIGAWQGLKTTMDLQPGDELKYAMSETHPSRARCDAAGWNVAKRIPEMLRVIASTEPVLIANTLTDERTGDGARITDLYSDGFNWCLRRFANHIEMNLSRPPGPHTVVIDMPSGRDEIPEEMQTRLLGQMSSMSTAAYECYQKRYLEAERFPNKLTGATALKDLGFTPTLQATHARFSDLHQMADVVAGCVAEYVNRNLAKSDLWGLLPGPTYREDNLRIVAPWFRAPKSYGSITSYGFGFFPGHDLATDHLVDRFMELRG